VGTRTSTTSAETQSLKLRQLQSVDQFESRLKPMRKHWPIQKAEELIAKREAAKQQSQVLESYHEREEEARGKYDDFEQVAYNPKLPITNVMAETIQSSDIGPELAYYLGSNPKEAERISACRPFAGKEIGKIEAKLASDPPVKKQHLRQRRFRLLLPDPLDHRLMTLLTHGLSRP
jgi:hypothetical protein